MKLPGALQLSLSILTLSLVTACAPPTIPPPTTESSTPILTGSPTAPPTTPQPATPTTRPREIVLTGPEESTVVTSPVDVEGRVSVMPFEANLRGRVYDARGRVVREEPIQVRPDVEGELGGPGTFAGAIPFQVDAAVPAEKTGKAYSSLMTFENPAIAARRIYLLDPGTGEYRRLNDVDGYQDAPVWSRDGERLYYVQRDRETETLVLMVADPETGEAQPIEESRLPAPGDTRVGYYGQAAWDDVLGYVPD